MTTPQDISRRAFAGGTLGSLMTYSVLSGASRRDAFTGPARVPVGKWLGDLVELGNAVKGGKLLQVDWQIKVEELLAKVDRADLLAAIDFEALTRDVQLPNRGEKSLRFEFPEVEGFPTSLPFGKQLFGVKKGRSIVPHGHDNMTTAFLILRGEFRGRHWDRVEDGGDVMILRPTIDQKFGPGAATTISCHHDNVHWYEALTDTAFIFNIHVPKVLAGSTIRPRRVYVDPDGAKMKGGLIRAKRIGSRDAHRRYG